MLNKMMLAATAALALLAGKAEAATIVETKVEGRIESSNDAAVQGGSVFTVLARYDSELIAADGEDILALEGGSLFSLKAGTLSFDVDDDLAAPQLRFFGGVLTGFDFATEQGDISAMLTGGTFVFTNNALGTSAFGELDFATATTLPVAAGAVPEPEQWAMMIIGFGIAGAAMRRSRQRGALLTAAA